MTLRANVLVASQTAYLTARRVLTKMKTTNYRTLGYLALSSTALTATLSLAIANTATAQQPFTQPSSAQSESVPADTAQMDSVPTDSIQAIQTPVSIEPPANPTPRPTPFSPNVAGIVDLSASETAPSIGIGHLRPQTLEGLETDNVNWLESVILPLYVSPGGEHWGWIYQGWLIPDGQTYLAIGRDAGFSMVKPYETLYTFPVLETRDDGWFRVQYTAAGSAWAHTSQLDLGETTLTVESWEDRLAAQDSIFFLENEAAQPLRSRPELANNMLSLVATDSLIEPLDFAGDWMRVRVTRPVAACTPLTGATTTEGWMRWRGEQSESLVWYKSDGSC